MPTWLTDYVWIILAGGGIAVFVADLIGNSLLFDNRRWNAIITATISGVIFGGALIADYQMEGTRLPFILNLQNILGLTFLALQSVFVADVIGNSLVFGNRVANALATGVIWCGVFYVTTVALMAITA